MARCVLHHRVRKSERKREREERERESEKRERQTDRQRQRQRDSIRWMRSSLMEYSRHEKDPANVDRTQDRRPCSIYLLRYTWTACILLESLGLQHGGCKTDSWTVVILATDEPGRVVVCSPLCTLVVDAFNFLHKTGVPQTHPPQQAKDFLVYAIHRLYSVTPVSKLLLQIASSTVLGQQ